jgi:hypothetical protein
MSHDLCYQEAELEFYRHIGKFQRNLLHPIQVTELAAYGACCKNSLQARTSRPAMVSNYGRERQ